LGGGARNRLWCDLHANTRMNKNLKKEKGMNE
jgi:hypothetical protein